MTLLALNPDGFVKWLTDGPLVFIIAGLGVLMVTRAYRRGASSDNMNTTINMVWGGIVIALAGTWFLFSDQIRAVIMT